QQREGARDEDRLASVGECESVAGSRWHPCRPEERRCRSGARSSRGAGEDLPAGIRARSLSLPSHSITPAGRDCFGRAGRPGLRQARLGVAAPGQADEYRVETRKGTPGPEPGRPALLCSCRARPYSQTRLSASLRTSSRTPAMRNPRSRTSRIMSTSLSTPGPWNTFLYSLAMSTEILMASSATFLPLSV